MSHLVVATNKPLHARVTISEEEIADLVHSFDAKAVVQSVAPLPHGFNNKISLVTTDTNKYVVKISVAEDKFKKLAVEADILEKLAAQTDLPVPKVLHSDFSQTTFAFPFAIYSYVSGENLVDCIEQVADKKVIGQELARAVAAIHSIHYPAAYFSLSSDKPDASWQAALRKKYDEAWPYFAQSGLPFVDTVRQELETGFANLKEPTSYTLIHRDLQPQNFHWDLTTNKLVGLFDFETAMSGDFLYEFSLLERNLFRLYPEIKESFYQTYSDISPLPENYPQQIAFYLLNQLVYFYMRSVQKSEDDRLAHLATEIEALSKTLS